jgi:CP family cyanate transporter-like MFS transporter
MLSMYTLIGLPHSLLVPIILARTRRPDRVIAFARYARSVGRSDWRSPPHRLGLDIPGGARRHVPAYRPDAGEPAHARTEEGATRLSGFVQGVGYLIAGTGPAGSLRAR